MEVCTRLVILSSRKYQLKVKRRRCYCAAKDDNLLKSTRKWSVQSIIQGLTINKVVKPGSRLSVSFDLESQRWSADPKIILIAALLLQLKLLSHCQNGFRTVRETAIA